VHYIEHWLTISQESKLFHDAFLIAFPIP